MPNQSKEAAATLPPADTAAERRSEPRYPAHEPVEVELQSSEPIHGTILDVSRSGLRLALSRRIDRGEQVKVKFHHNIVFGEIRYCRAVSGGFHAGLQIQDLVRPSVPADDHIADEQLLLYAAGKGLSASEVIGVRAHLVRCEICGARLAETEATLRPSRRRGPRRPMDSEPPA